MTLHRIDPRAGWVRGNRQPCRECGAAPPPNRRTFCSAACVDAWKIRTSPQHVRAMLLKRDHGVCAVCGFDAGLLEGILHDPPRCDRRDYRARAAASRLWAARRACLRAALQEAGFDTYLSLWAADHIVPVADGGGGVGLDGYRTLCVPCHKIVTAAWRKERARVRVAARLP